MDKKHFKILIVDDEPDIITSFQSFFVRRGFFVNTTSNGKDAVDIIKTSKPDLVFLDLSLPEMSGTEILKELRKFDNETKVIIVTGHTIDSKKEEDEFSSLGISAYLNKPIKLEELADIVELILGNQFSFKDFEKYKLVKRPAESIAVSSRVHRLRNLLGNMRNECEVFILNKKDGIYNDTLHEELNEMSDEIIQNVIKTVDQIIEVLDG